MGIGKFIKPSILKLLIFLFIGALYLLLAKENVGAAGLFFAFSYNAYGFPLQYLITGQIDSATSEHVKTLFLGDYFIKYGNALINPVALAIDIILIYLLSCLLATLFKNMKSNIDTFKKQQ